MTVFKDLHSNLQNIFRIWENLDENDRKLKTNLMMPIIQNISLVGHFAKIAGDDSVAKSCLKMLEEFNREYRNIFGQDLEKMSYSDISPELMKRIEQTQITGAAGLNTEERQSLLGYKNKYVHAHDRVMYNYGKFLSEIFSAQNEEGRAELAKRITQLATTEDKKEFLSELVSINQDFKLEANSSIILKDDLENHALLNQMSNWMQHVAQIPQIMLDDELYAKARSSISSQIYRHSAIKRSSELSSLVNEVVTAAENSMASKGMSAMCGIESEMMVYPLESESRSNINADIKEITGDLNARRAMQTKYGLLPTIPQIDDVTKLFAEGIERSISERDYQMIFRDIGAYYEEKIKSTDSTKERVALDTERHLVEQQLANFTTAETFFYKFLFIEKEFENGLESERFFAQDRIDMDGVYNPRGSKEENLTRVLSLIKSGQFHSKLLDMIQACEFSIEPCNLSEVINRKNGVIERARLVANHSECWLDNPNVQLNFSFEIERGDGEKQNIFMPRITGRGGEARMEFNELGREVLHLIEEAVAEVAETQGVLRNQVEVGAAFDRKKIIGKDESAPLWGSPYLAIDPNKPAFLNHKSLAAKNDTLRVSVIKNNSVETDIDGVAVCEIRLIGNNPHLARFAEQTVGLNGLDFIPEVLMAAVTKKVGEFVAKTERAKLLEMLDSTVEISHDGKFCGLDSVKVLGQNKRDNIFDQDSQLPYNTTKARDSVALVSTALQQSH